MRKSHQEDTQAMLNVAKILKEIQGLDIQHLQSKIDTLHAINNLNFEPDFSGQNQKNNVQKQIQGV